MAFPLRPGVTLNESLTPLTSVDTTAGRSSAVFVGLNTTGGPTDPTLITSWGQFSQTYGGFGSGTDLLPFAVYQFFSNGGGSCYVIRAVNGNATAASASLADSDSSTALQTTFTAKAPGAYGNGISVSVAAGASASTVGVTITQTVNGKVTSTEVYNDVSLDPSASNTRNLLSVINGASRLVIASGPAITGAFTSSLNPAVTASPVSLTGGADGTGTPDLVAATQRISTISGTFDVNLPGVSTSATINSLVSWATTAGNVFLVVDGVLGASTDTAATSAAAQKALVTSGGLPPSSDLAVYGPWLYAADPTSSVQGSTRLLPPGGFVLGQYARTDVSRGVQKVAAGIDASLRGVIAPQFLYADADLDTLNQAGVNVIRPIAGAGICIYGGRTLATATPDRYINIRRTLITLKAGLKSTTNFAVFENNDAVLRQQVTDLCDQYLRTSWASGMLSGASEAQAFYVICDSTNNTPTTISQGAVNIEVGLALQTPSEFVIFNIGQTAAGSTTSTSA